MYANQQARPSYPPQYPPGWNPPFNGAPPMPQGINVKPQDWNAGQWQFNPAFKQAGANVHVPWIPSQAWQQSHPHSHAQSHPQQQQQQQQQQQRQQQPAHAQQQQQQQQNPFQRPSKPPSESYLNLPVSNNALNLTGMVPREKVYSDNPGGPHTPWIWNPRGLVETDDSDGIINADFRDAFGRRVAQESRGATPTRRPSSTAPSAAPSPSPQHQRQHSQTRQSSEPAPSPRPIYAHASASAQAQAQAPTAMRRASEPAPSSSSESRQQEREEFQRQEMLRPTFSSSIVRIPEHYRDSPVKRTSSSASASRSHGNDGPTNSASGAASSSSRHRRPQTRSFSGEVELASRMEQMSTSSGGIKRHSSMPATERPLVEEPTTMLSPLILSDNHNTTTSSSTASRGLGRHHTVPTLTAIPETTSIYSNNPTPNSTSSGSRMHAAPSPRSMTSSPSSHASSSPQRRTPTPQSSASPRRHNPLPSPPREIHYGYTPPNAAPVSTPPSTPRRTRLGWWNRRGDHLTDDGKIVYSPPDLAFPDELRDYPREGEAWLNHKGQYVTNNSSWKELEESLPRLGRKPIRPYESFLLYVQDPKKR